MKAFMTSGTLNFLEKITEKNAQLTFFLMNSASSTLAYYEGEGKSVFGAGREYEIVIKSGNIQETGYIVMNNIPLTEEGKPVFEDRFKQRQEDISSLQGLQAFRMLKPLKGSTYVILTQWASGEDYKTWKDSDDFTKSHENQAVKPPAYFAARPFVTSYSMVIEDEDEN